MVIQARAKINWALNIRSRRADGYHEMDMLMQRIALCDELTLEADDRLSLKVLDGRAPLPASDNNLVLRAARALNAREGVSRGARMRLVKRIPERAGLGGGSADCAAALMALNRLWGLKLPMSELSSIGFTLGADVPFCLMNGAARATGLGERLQPVEAGAPVPLVILHPGGGLSTPEMFRRWDEEVEHTQPADIEVCIRALKSSDLAQMTRSARNMLYDCAVRALPEVEAARLRLLELGASFAAMSGSGSAVFGAFEQREAAQACARILGESAILTETCSY